MCTVYVAEDVHLRFQPSDSFQELWTTGMVYVCCTETGRAQLYRHFHYPATFLPTDPSVIETDSYRGEESLDPVWGSASERTRLRPKPSGLLKDLSLPLHEFDR